VLTGNSQNNTLVAGTGNDTLNGGAGFDTYRFNTSKPLGSDTITDTQGNGTVTFAGSSLGCTLDLSQAGVAQAVNSNLTLTLASGSSVENIAGGNGNDMLTGNASNNTLVAGPGNAVLSGGGGSDSYLFNTSRVLGSDTLSDTTGHGTVSFAGSSLGCTFDLSRTGNAQVVNANLTLTLSSGTLLQNLYGGNGNDILTGNSLNNTIRGNGGVDFIFGKAGNNTLYGGAGGGVVVGGTGTNTIFGGAGRSVLIGGAGSGADHVTGGGVDGSIVIGGSTSFDTNLAALQALLAEWQRTDIGYTQRIADLRNGVVDSNSQTDALVWGSTVLDNGGKDVLNGEPVGTSEPGGPELDWFFANLASGHDTIGDRDPNEVVN
jgi:Ca2+-binding RTX toxin-like protein